MTNFGIFMGVILLISLIIFLTLKGIILCKENDAIGVVYLFLGLLILGLVIGWAILYNARNDKYITREAKKTITTKVFDKESETWVEEEEFI